MSMLSKIVIAAGLGLAALPAASIPSLAADWQVDGYADPVEVDGWERRGASERWSRGDGDEFVQVQYRDWDRDRGWDRRGRRSRCEVVTRIIRTPYGTRRIQEERCGGRPAWDRPGWDHPGRGRPGWDRPGRPGWSGANPPNWGRTDGHTLTTEERAFLR